MVDYGVLAVEMEASALYTLAAKHGRRALAICTVSDHIVTGEETTSQEREQTFGDMVEIALDGRPRSADRAAGLTVRATTGVRPERGDLRRGGDRRRPGRAVGVVPPEAPRDLARRARRRRRPRWRLAAPLGLADACRTCTGSPPCPTRSRPASPTGGPTTWCRRTSPTTSAPTTCRCVRPVRVDRVTRRRRPAGRARRRPQLDARARSSTRPAPGRSRTCRTTRASRLPRRAAAHGRLPGAGALPRQAGRGRRRRRVRRAVPRRARAGRATRCGSPAASRSGAPTSSTPTRGRAAVALVEERVRRGLPPASVVSVTGLALREQEREAERLGAYERHPMFASIEPDGVRMRRRQVRAGRRDPLGHRLPAGGHPPRSPAPALRARRHPARPAPRRSPTRGCSWSATARRRAPSAPTAPAGSPPAASPTWLDQELGQDTPSIASSA